MADRETGSPLPGPARERQRAGPLVAMAILYLAAVSGFMIWRGISASVEPLAPVGIPDDESPTTSSERAKVLP